MKEKRYELNFTCIVFRKAKLEGQVFIKLEDPAERAKNRPGPGQNMENTNYAYYLLFLLFFRVVLDNEVNKVICRVNQGHSR